MATFKRSVGSRKLSHRRQVKDMHIGVKVNVVLV